MSSTGAPNARDGGFFIIGVLVSTMFGFYSATRVTNNSNARESDSEGNSKEQDGEQKYQDRNSVKCPLCRVQTIRSSAITGILHVEDECCCCMDATCSVALTCGHLCLCQACFQKL